MQPRMSADEFTLFSSFVRVSERYFEFGTGGSTFAASLLRKSWIISIDSSQQWLDRVASKCAANNTKPELIFKDIGPVGDWGNPIDPSTRSRWPEYHGSVWNCPRSMNADLYLVDGRFRVACFAQIVLHCRPDAIIGFHDFASRRHYHCVREIAREIAVAESMAFFQPLSVMRENAANILEKYMFDPA
jgi:hypothetical protein